MAKKFWVVEKKRLTGWARFGYKRDSFGAVKKFWSRGLKKKMKKEVDKAEWF